MTSAHGRWLWIRPGLILSFRIRGAEVRCSPGMARQGHGDRLRLLTWGSWARAKAGGSPRWGWTGTARAVSVPSTLTQGGLFSIGLSLCSSHLLFQLMPPGHNVWTQNEQEGQPIPYSCLIFVLLSSFQCRWNFRNVLSFCGHSKLLSTHGLSPDSKRGFYGIRQSI